MVWERCCVTKMCLWQRCCVKDGVWQSVGERWCGRRGAEEEEAEEDNTGDADLKTRTPHNFVGKNQKSGWRVFYLLNGMCLSQPSSLYQRCFLFPLLKGPGFPTVFLENFPIFEGFLRAKCFPTVSARAQGCKKIKIKYNKIKSRRQTHTPGKNTGDRTLQICIKHAMCFSQWYVPVLFVLFLFYFFLPGGPGEEPLEFLPPEVP